MAIRFLIVFVFGFHLAHGILPDIPKHYDYRYKMFENLADEIINSAVKQDVLLYRNDVLTTIQNTLNPVLDEVLIQANKYEVCASTNEQCVQEQIAGLKQTFQGKTENNYFNFYKYQVYIWTKIYISPKQGWDNLNDWYPKYIAHNFNLAPDSLFAKNTNNVFLNTRVMFYRLKEDLFPNEQHISKSLFTAYYNQCVHLLKQPSIILYEFENKVLEVDSLMQIASKIKDVNKSDECKADMANVYVAAAFNDNFPMGVGKDELLKMFYISNNLITRSLEIHETGKAHYALGALYNNFLIDYNTMYSKEEQLELFGKALVPSELMEESIQHLERACELDAEYCNLKKFKDKRR